MIFSQIEETLELGVLPLTLKLTAHGVEGQQDGVDASVVDHEFVHCLGCLKFQYCMKSICSPLAIRFATCYLCQHCHNKDHQLLYF